MGLLYLDASREYTDPANTGLKYLRADGQWAAPDSDHRFLDATGEWSVPELVTIPDDLSTPENVLAASEAAKVNPTAVYEKLRDTLTPAISFGSTYGSHPFRIVATNKEEVTGGGKAGLVLLCEEHFDAVTAIRSKNESTGGYWQCDTMRTYLQNAYYAMDSVWRAIVKPVNIIYATSATQTSVDGAQRLFPPSAWNLGLYNSTYGPKEGECWDYFVGTPETAADAKRIRRGKSSNDWWTRSPNFSITGYYSCVYSSGSLVTTRAMADIGVVPAFCV